MCEESIGDFYMAVGYLNVFNQISSRANSLSTVNNDYIRRQAPKSANAEQIGDYKVNSNSNKFLKEYIETKASKKGVQIPENMEIEVSSPDKYSPKFKKDLQHVSNKIYKARVVDLFNLLEQDSDSVSQRVEKMKISDDDKQKILQLKSQFDNFYKIEAKVGDRKYDLLNPTESDIKDLNELSPEFAQFVQDEKEDINTQTKNFARKEMSALRLNEAGRNSAVAAGGLATILAFLVGKGVFDSREDARLLKLDKAEFLKNQAEIFEEGIPKFQNPIKEFVEAAKNGFTKSKAKDPKKVVLSALLLTTLAGSADDLMGCVKDSIQDIDNFGAKTGLGINIPAAFCGIATSMAIAPMIEGEILYKRAGKYLNKYKDELKGLGIEVKDLEKAKGLSSIVRTGGKIAVMSTLAMAVTNVVKGMITATSSSGSSWGSMAGTRFVLDRAGDTLEDKNIITKEENTFKNTTKNLMAYEAYKGKWTGIAQQDPLIGATGGALGLFTHANPYVQSLAFGLQGCSETLTACYYQVTGAHDRKDKLASDKQKLIESAKS